MLEVTRDTRKSSVIDGIVRAAASDASVRIDIDIGQGLHVYSAPITTTPAAAFATITVMAASEGGVDPALVDAAVMGAL